MKVTLVDHGAGNVASVERALTRIGVVSERTIDPRAVAGTEMLILPGVGHFAALVRALDERGLRHSLLDALSHGVPFLGICLGLQALHESSDEAPDLRGLGILRGRVAALPSEVKLPHMGWNRVRALTGARLFHGIAPDSYFYFAHSYAAPVSSQAAATCTYGAPFAAAVEGGNLFAVQFHPEKSGIAGEQLLRNFVSIAA